MQRFGQPERGPGREVIVDGVAAVGDVEEWVTTRTPALLRYAYLLTGNTHDAQDLVQDALTTVVQRWSRIASTEDPDRYVRRMIANGRVSAWRRFGRRVTPVAQFEETPTLDAVAVSTERDVIWRACQSLPTKQRAAVVLRYYEDLPDADIAATSTAHRPRCALRSTARWRPCAPTLPPRRQPMSTDRTDAELEHLLRQSLREQAAQAPTTLPDPVPAAAATRHRNRRLGWIAGVAAAGVVAAGLSWSTMRGDDPIVATTDPATSTGSLTVPPGWRAESYAGIQLAVPDTWGWGGSPGPGATSGGNEYPANEPFQGEVFCGIFGSFVSPDGQTTGNAEAKPFVGRPMMMTDACGDNPNGHPSVDAVWFSTPLPLGEKRFDDGQVALTRQVAGQMYTVFARDDALRAQIADSAVALGDADINGCPRTLPGLTPYPGIDPAQPDTAGLSICLYRAGALFVSSSATASQASAYLSAVIAARPGREDCMTMQVDGQNLRLGVRSATRPTRWASVDPNCGLLATPDEPLPVQLDDAIVEPWAAPVLKAYVTSGPVWGDGTRWFRGILG